MSERTINKNFNNFRGRDIRSSDLVRDADYAIEFQNARVAKEDSCVKREGFKIRAPKGQYEGLFSYNWNDIDNNDTSSELISISDNIYKQISSSFTVTYSGSDSPTYISICLDTSSSTFKCILVEDGSEVLNYDLGTGLESSPVTLSNLKTQIDAITNFSAVISGTTSIPAAFLPCTLYADLISSSQVLEVLEWEKINTLVNNIFGTYHGARGAETWELASCVNINNVLYIATGYEYLHKYDGQNVYRAGLPYASTDPTTSLSATGITDTNVEYIYLYKQVDNRGNIIEGVESFPSSPVSPVNQKILVTVANIEAGDGFNTGCAIVNGTQAGVTTITVDSGHTFKVGDTAYFLDGVSSSYVERGITAKTATTITIDGANVNVLDNAVISNNLRIVIYRNTAGGSIYYKVAEIPNNSFASTQVYSDALAIASLGTEYQAPTFPRDLLEVIPRYLCDHQNLLITSYGNTWFFSSGESPEYFPAETNFNQIKATKSGGIRGLGSDQEHLVIGTEGNLYVITGDLVSGNARQEDLGNGVGFACHNSITTVGDKLMFLTKYGFWSLKNGYNLEEIGAPINPIFTTKGAPTTETPKLRRAVAAYFDETQEYICFIPNESGTGTAKYANTTSSTHVFDDFHQAWAEWTGLNMGGGLTIYENNIYFQSKVEDASVTVTGYLWIRSAQGVVDDYSDHNEAIDFKLGSQWLFASEPSVFKVFLRLKVYNLLRQLLSATFTLDVSVERNLSLGLTWFSFQLDFGTSLSSVGWGYFSWGIDPWGTVQEESQKIKLKSGKAKSIRFVMRNNELNQKAAISAWETVYTAPYNIELKD